MTFDPGGGAAICYNGYYLRGEWPGGNEVAGSSGHLVLFPDTAEFPDLTLHRPETVLQ